MHCLQSLEYVSKIEIPSKPQYLSSSEQSILNSMLNRHAQGAKHYGDGPIVRESGKKLAVFDMDETLIHTLYKRNKDSKEAKEHTLTYDAKVPITNADGSMRYLFINIRPYVLGMLRKLRKWFHIVVFTASLPTYANAILDYIDPNNEIFERRFYRQHWFITKDRVYIKDLRIFTNPKIIGENWDIKDIVIIDNAAHSFGFQIDNGIPILPFYNDREEDEMVYLYYFLKSLAEEDGKKENKDLYRCPP